MPDDYDTGQLTSLEFIDRAQDLVFYGKTGRGKTHLATALGVKTIGQGRAVRFCQTAVCLGNLGSALWSLVFRTCGGVVRRCGRHRAVGWVIWS